MMTSFKILPCFCLAIIWLNYSGSRAEHIQIEVVQQVNGGNFDDGETVGDAGNREEQKEVTTVGNGGEEPTQSTTTSTTTSTTSTTASPCSDGFIEVPPLGCVKRSTKRVKWSSDLCPEGSHLLQGFEKDADLKNLYKMNIVPVGYAWVGIMGYNWTDGSAVEGDISSKLYNDYYCGSVNVPNTLIPRLSISYCGYIREYLCQHDLQN